MLHLNEQTGEKEDIDELYDEYIEQNITDSDLLSWVSELII